LALQGGGVEQEGTEPTAWLIVQLTSKLAITDFLFHPAAALYNGGMRGTLKEDFSRIPAILNKIRKETK